MNRRAGRYSGGGVDLLSETYTQLHTIDGLAGPQTYKCLSLGVHSNLILSQNIGTAVEQVYYNAILTTKFLGMSTKLCRLYAGQRD